MKDAKEKKSKKDRTAELRDDGFKKRTGGVNYDALSDKRVDDRRHEREKAYKEQQAARVAESQKSGSAGGSTSSTFDAFQRMATGKEGRTLAEKIADPNRPTWEQYKKDNEDKLDNIGAEVRKMAEYRAQLDREREQLLLKNAQNAKKRRMEYSDSEEDGEEGSSSSSDEDDNKKKDRKKSKKSSSKKEKKSKKDKSKKKSKKKKRTHSSDDESEHGGSGRS